MRWALVELMSKSDKQTKNDPKRVDCNTIFVTCEWLYEWVGPLVLQRYIAEQIGHGLLVVNAANGLSDQNGDVDRLDLMALQLLYLVWNGIGYNDLSREIVNKIMSHIQGN